MEKGDRLECPLRVNRILPDWRIVRGVGQLQLLNRASMVMVVFVPLLAALWAAVPRWLDWQEAPPLLPDSWALLFFGSLAVLLGRTIFQLGCPEVVQHYTHDDFVRERKHEYSNSPSLVSVQQAMLFLKGHGMSLELVEQEQRTEDDVLDKVRSIQAALDEALAEIASMKADRAATADHEEWDRTHGNRLRDANYEARNLREDLTRLVERDRGDRGPDFRRKLALVELSARSEYLIRARRARLLAIVCIGLYTGAAYCVGAVILSQTRAVALASGWLR